MRTTTGIDLPIGLTTMDETRLPWTFFDEAAGQSPTVPGAHVIAEARSSRHRNVRRRRRCGLNGRETPGRSASQGRMSSRHPPGGLGSFI